MHLDLSASRLNCFDAQTLALELGTAYPTFTGASSNGALRNGDQPAVVTSVDLSMCHPLIVGQPTSDQSLRLDLDELEHGLASWRPLLCSLFSSSPSLSFITSLDLSRSVITREGVLALMDCITGEAPAPPAVVGGGVTLEELSGAAQFESGGSHTLYHLTHLDLSQNVWLHDQSSGYDAIEKIVHTFRLPYQTPSLKAIRGALARSSADTVSATNRERISLVACMEQVLAEQLGEETSGAREDGEDQEETSEREHVGADGSNRRQPIYCPNLTSLNINGSSTGGSYGVATMLVMALVRVRPRLHWLGVIPTVNRYGGDPADLTRASESALGATVANYPSAFPTALVPKLMVTAMGDGFCQPISPLTLVEMRLCGCKLDDGDLALLACYFHVDSVGAALNPLGTAACRGQPNTNAATLQVLDLSQNQIYSTARAGSEMRGFLALWQALISLAAYTKSLGAEESRGLREIDLSDNCLTCAAASVMNRLPDRIYFPELFPHPLSHMYLASPEDQTTARDNKSDNRGVVRRGQCSVCRAYPYEVYASIDSWNLSRNASGSTSVGNLEEAFSSSFYTYTICSACVQTPTTQGVPANVAELFAAERRRRVLPALEVLRLNGCLLGMCWTEDAGLLPTASALRGLSDAINGGGGGGGGAAGKNEGRKAEGEERKSVRASGSEVGVGMPRLRVLEMRGGVSRCDYYKLGRDANRPPWPQALEVAFVSPLDSSALNHFVSGSSYGPVDGSAGTLGSTVQSAVLEVESSDLQNQAKASLLWCQQLHQHYSISNSRDRFRSLVVLDISHNDLHDRRRAWLHHVRYQATAAVAKAERAGHKLPVHLSRYEAALPLIAGSSDGVEKAIAKFYQPLTAIATTADGEGDKGLRLIQARGYKRHHGNGARQERALMGSDGPAESGTQAAANVILANEKEVEGAAVIFSRGAITFIEMVKAAADAGAKLILIANDDRSGGNTFAEMNIDRWHRYNVPVLQVTYNCAVAITQMQAGHENRIHLTVEGMRGLTMLSRLIEEGGLPGLKELYLSGMESRIWRQKFVDLATEKDFALGQ
jgi:hypothetical protein